MSGSEPGGAREKKSQRKTVDQKQEEACLRVLLSLNIGEERRGGLCRFLVISGTLVLSEPHLLQHFLFSFAAEWSCFNLIWPHSKRPLGAFGLCLDRLRLLRVGQHVHRASPPLLLQDDASSSQWPLWAKENLSQSTNIFGKPCQQSPQTLKNGIISWQAMNLFHYTTTAWEVDCSWHFWIRCVSQWMWYREKRADNYDISLNALIQKKTLMTLDPNYVRWTTRLWLCEGAKTQSNKMFPSHFIFPTSTVASTKRVSVTQ